MADLSNQVIRHGTITRFVVRKGEIGLAWDNNNPAFFEGISNIVQTFSFWVILMGVPCVILKIKI